MEWKYDCLGAGSDTSEKSSKTPASTSSDNVKVDGKHQQEVFHWHNRLIF
jgi:ATP-dependent Lon protease